MDQWSPTLKEQGGESLYGAMLRRVQAVGGRVRGVLWYQGESDANPKAAPEFQQKFERFVAAVRQDFGQPDLPFYYVQIGRHVNNSNIAEWNAVQDAQRKAELVLSKPAAMVASIDLGLDDGIHIGTQDLKRLGARMAKLACKDLFPSVQSCQSIEPGPRPQSVQQNGAVLRVKFSGVNGSLRADGRISGFTIHNANGEMVPMIFKIIHDFADAAGILIHIQGKMPEGAVLMYGAGKDPYCNLRDQADLAVPVFSMPIGSTPPSAQ
jgi:sialate O-acetylesterase